MYDSVADKKQAEVESYLRELGADRERVKRLCGWKWVHEALDRLPPPPRQQPDYKPPRLFRIGIG